jgi:long-chain acyl-CoA synthetase
VQDAAGSRQFTYAEFWARVERGAAALKERGLAPGDRVLIALPSGPGWMPALLAVSHADLVSVPIPGDTPPDRARLAAMFTGVKAWIGASVQGELSSALAHVPRITPEELEGEQSRVDSLRAAIADHRASGRDSSATAVLVFTSGSTTRPRAVALSHAGIRANLRALLAARQAVPDEALLSTLPPSHAYELVAGQLAPLAAGARIVYGGVALPNRLIDAIRTQGITRVALVPALFELLVYDVIGTLTASGDADASWHDLPVPALAARLNGFDDQAAARLRRAVRRVIGDSLQTIVIGGAAVHPAWSAVLGSVGIALDVGYGLTEAGPVVAMGRAQECPPGSVGRPLAGVDVRIGADGEILVRTEAVMQGYAGDADATAAAIEDGWLRTGDRGRIDPNGFLFVTGRIKEAMVTSAGETIYPEEVEPYFRSPLFAEWAVVPARGPDGNDRPTLVVVPADPVADETAIRQRIASLNAAAPAGFRIAEAVVRYEPLPRTAVGKIRRRVLADTLAQTRATRAT